MRRHRRLTDVLAVPIIICVIAACVIAACAPASTRQDRDLPATPHPSATAPTGHDPGSTSAGGKARLGKAAGPGTSAGGGSRTSTAAARYSWTNVAAHDDFSGSTLDQSWGAYDSAGNAGKGIRSPKQIGLHDGVLRMTGTAGGTTAGMSWRRPQRYGRWEIRARFPAGCECYHPVLILWPAEDPWPVGGEIDYAEVFDAGRQKLNFFLHYTADNKQLYGTKQIDMTRWHNFAVEWTPDHVTGYVDGQQFFHTDRRDVLPPGPMNPTVQLDWFPGATKGGATLELEWATIYRL